ncbi:hypothetical protein BDW59DRAFT_149812 [Aspergillus cavernicola]|uniref:BTB domain-containing protein n=1 Tax=Aspergillus cavernicola TaxID=176166 RepID=A0ABR4I491_9EURO
MLAMSSLQQHTPVDPAEHQHRDIEYERRRQQRFLWRSGFRDLRRKHLVWSLSRLVHHPVLASFSDMVVVCGSENISFRCHKAIVCAQSVAIRECCSNASVRDQSCAIKIKCHPLVFRMAVEYFYTCDYEFFLDWDFPTWFSAEGQAVPVDYVDRLDCCELSLHLQVHILAKCLRIPGLRYLSAWKISSLLQKASLPTVYPRFVREVYTRITKEDAIIKRVIVDHAEQVVRGSRARNHYDGRFPQYLFEELPEFSRDFHRRLFDFSGPWDNNSTTIQLSPTHWHC